VPMAGIDPGLRRDGHVYRWVHVCVCSKRRPIGEVELACPAGSRRRKIVVIVPSPRNGCRDFRKLTWGFGSPSMRRSQALEFLPGPRAAAVADRPNCGKCPNELIEVKAVRLVLHQVGMRSRGFEFIWYQGDR
jgi:hypothetical protein